jgi:hypothetical protein
VLFVDRRGPPPAAARYPATSHPLPPNQRDQNQKVRNLNFFHRRPPAAAQNLVWSFKPV